MSDTEIEDQKQPWTLGEKLFVIGMALVLIGGHIFMSAIDGYAIR